MGTSKGSIYEVPVRTLYFKCVHTKSTAPIMLAKYKDLFWSVEILFCIRYVKQKFQVTMAGSCFSVSIVSMTTIRDASTTLQEGAFSADVTLTCTQALQATS